MWNNCRNIKKCTFVQCAHSKDSHLRSLIRIFTGCNLDSQGCKVSSCGHWRLWSDCGNAQADLSLFWALISEGTFSHVKGQLFLKYYFTVDWLRLSFSPIDEREQGRPRLTSCLCNWTTNYQLELNLSIAERLNIKQRRSWWDESLWAYHLNLRCLQKPIITAYGKHHIARPRSHWGIFAVQWYIKVRYPNILLEESKDSDYKSPINYSWRTLFFFCIVCHMNLYLSHLFTYDIMLKMGKFQNSHQWINIWYHSDTDTRNSLFLLEFMPGQLKRYTLVFKTGRKPSLRIRTARSGQCLFALQNCCTDKQRKFGSGFLGAQTEKKKEKKETLFQRF